MQLLINLGNTSSSKLFERMPPCISLANKGLTLFCIRNIILGIQCRVVKVQFARRRQGRILIIRPKQVDVKKMLSFDVLSAR